MPFTFFFSAIDDEHAGWNTGDTAEPEGTCFLDCHFGGWLRIFTISQESQFGVFDSRDIQFVLFFLYNMHCYYYVR